MSEPGVRHFRSLGRKRQRLAARVSPRVPSAEPSSDTGIEEAWLIDLGLGGACIELDGAFDPGREVRLLVDLPGLWEPLELTAEVAWRGSPDKAGKVLTGVRFVQPSGKALRLLSETLAAEFR